MAPAPAPAAGAPFAVMARAAFLPSALVGAVTSAVVCLVRGPHAIAASAFGLVVALAFFGFGMLVLSRLVRQANLTLFFGIAMAVYLFQIIGLLVVILIVRRADWVDRPAMAIVIAVVTIAWQLFAMRALRKSRIPIYDEPAITGDGGSS